MAGLLALRVMGEGIVELPLDLERDILGAFRARSVV